MQWGPDLHGLCAWRVLFCCSQIFEQESPHCRFPLVPANYVMSDVFNLTSVNVRDRSQLSKANQFTFSLNFIFLVSSGISLLLFFSESPAPQFSFFWIIPFNLHLTRLLLYCCMTPLSLPTAPIFNSLSHQNLKRLLYVFLHLITLHVFLIYSSLFFFIYNFI